MKYQELLRVLRDRSGGGSKYGIERMQALLAALDHPQRAFASWHIAGTNGKGSVSAMLESIARQAGEKTGLNTSPHLNRLGERIRINGAELSQADLIEVFQQVDQVRQQHGLEATFFELMTAMAFVAFARKRVERAVVEVGLGGRLDASNTMDSEVTAVVSIALDHTRILGATTAEIAREKAAICRSSRPMVLGFLDDEALAAALQVIGQRGALPILLAEHYHLEQAQGEQAQAWIEFNGQQVQLRPKLRGEHQLQNSGIAALVALLSGIATDHIERGIEQAQWPGRLEFLSLDGREYLFDCAHNLAGAEALGLSLKHGFGCDNCRAAYNLVMATSGGRDSGAFLQTLAQHIGWPQQIILCRPEGHRLLEPEQLGENLQAVLPAATALQIIRDPLQALRAGDSNICTLVTGSMYLVGQALALLKGEPRDAFETGR